MGMLYYRNIQFIPESQRRVLIPLGYLYPGNGKALAKPKVHEFINNRGRVALFHGWTSYSPTDLKSMLWEEKHSESKKIVNEMSKHI